MHCVSGWLDMRVCAYVAAEQGGAQLVLVGFWQPTRKAGSPEHKVGSDPPLAA